MIAKTPEEIVIDNNKAVEHLRIPVPVGGGVVVLRGDNGSGKTEALNAVRAALGNKAAKTALRPSDGEKAGTVEGLGVKISIGRANREKGDLTVSSLEDRLDINDLVDPGITDPNAADAKRLKALLRVCGAEGNAELFRKLVGPDFEFDPEVVKERDLIKQAASIKKTLESKARAEESRAEAATLEVTANLKALEGVDLNAESDEATLQVEYRLAVQADTALNQQARAAIEAEADRKRATAALEAARKSYIGPTVADASTAVDAAKSEVDSAQDMVQILENQLREARSDLARAESELRLKQQQLDAANSHVATTQLWQDQLNRELPQLPSDDELQEATDRLAAAELAVQNGAVVRRALAAKAKADEATTKARAHAKQAEHWREAAKSVDEVLSDQVAKLGCPITVGEDDKGLRLMVTHKRGTIPFGELSAGEKWNLVIPIAVRAVGEDGVFVIPQEAWEGLQPRIRKSIVDLLQGSHVTAITAECADGPIHAEVS